MPPLVALSTIVFGSFGCGTPAEVGREDGGRPPPRVDAGADAGTTTSDDAGAASCATGDPFEPAALRADVEYLASSELGGRAVGTAGDVAARAYIEERFRCLGLEPGAGDSFQQTFANAAGDETANVVALIRGSDVASEVLIVGAHHDHLGSDGGDVYLGANDNASGVAGLLAVAKAVRARPTPPRRTIAFIAFGSEETLSAPPYVEGSAFYQSHTPSALAGTAAVYMINFDMIGTYSSDETVYALGSYAETPARDALDSLAASRSITVDLGSTPEVGASDFYPFCEAGVPFVFFWTDDPDCYHSPCDTADHLDYPELAEIARLGFDLLAALDATDDLASATPGSCGE